MHLIHPVHFSGQTCIFHMQKSDLGFLNIFMINIYFNSLNIWNMVVTILIPLSTDSIVCIIWGTVLID